MKKKLINYIIRNKYQDNFIQQINNIFYKV